MKSFIVNLMPSFLVRTFARPYVAGDSIEKGINKTDVLWNEKGISSTLDLLGEAVYDRKGVEFNVQTYLTLLEQVNNRDFVTVSMKPSSLGIHESDEYCFQNMDTILTKADQLGINITLDMEDHTFTDVTLKLYRELLMKHPTFGTVLQSRLFRTEDDIDSLKDLKGRIRICIGIYNESKDISLTNKADMKEKMLVFAEILINHGYYTEFATHDEGIIQKFFDMIDKNGWKPDQLEFQQLLGVPMEKIQQEILDRGFVNRLYVPFAVGWRYATPYLKRRLAHNPKMGIYVIKNLFRK